MALEIVARDDSLAKFAPGKYECSRVVKLSNGLHFVRKIECVNPAVGVVKLDEWEQALLIIRSTKKITPPAVIG